MKRKIVGIFVCTTLLISTTSIILIESVKAADPVRLWHFDENSGNIAYDSTGNNDGVIYGAVWSSDAASGYALDFDGLNDIVDVGNVGVNIYSCIIWIKPAVNFTKNTSPPNVLSWFHDPAFCVWLGSYADPSHHKQTIGLADTRAAYEDRTYVVDLTISNTDWHMLVLNWDGANGRYDIYFDGVEQLVTPGPHGHVQLMTAGQMYIGDRPGYTYHYNGLMDEVSLYNTVFTPLEIQQIYDDIISILPTADFTYLPVDPKSSDVIQFNDNSTDVDGSVVDWWWDFGDGYFSNLENPVHCYYNSGIYNVTLTATDDKGFENSTQKTIAIPSVLDIVYVDDDYSPSTPSWGYNHFGNIQDGIDAVDEGGTIYVFNGTYHENVIVNKTIDLIGEDKNTTIIDGGGSGDVVFINSDSVNIRNFKIRDSGASGYNAGIHLISDYNTITDNILTDNNEDGIKLWNSNNNIIFNNNILDNGNDGIYIWGTDNQISKNYIYMSGDDGIDNRYSHRNLIFENNISSGFDDGLVFYEDCTENIVNDNVIKNNDYGVRLWNLGNDNNKFYHNKIIDNYQNANDESSNTWDDGYPSGGNYWSDYTGTDLDGDGIGDTPYPIPGGSKQDNYPLGFFHPIANFTYSPVNPTTFDTIQFTDTSVDPDGTIISWWWDFDDGNTSSLQNPTHQYVEAGTYDVALTVTDDDGKTDTILKIIEVTILSNPPSIPDIPSGKTSGKINRLYSYETTTTDPDGDQIYYRWDWDEGKFSDWFGPYDSDETVSASHMWTEKGDYYVRVKAKDINDVESDWSDPLLVSMK